MPRKMYDSVTPEAIPRNAEMVAGYIDGTASHIWHDEDWARFPNAVKVRIARRPETNDGHVLDVEPRVNGGEWPPGPRMVRWVQMRRAAGMDPSVYCNQLNDWLTVRKQFTDRGVPEPHYWVARYDNRAVIPVGAVAKQYAHPPQLGFNADASIVADYWPGVDEGDDVSAQEVWAYPITFTPPGATKAVTFSAAQFLVWGNYYAGLIEKLFKVIADNEVNDVTLDQLRTMHAEQMAKMEQLLKEATIDVDVTVGGEAVENS